jgi:hypothetical protein
VPIGGVIEVTGKNEIGVMYHREIYSPRYRAENKPRPWTLEDKVDIFEDRVLGWQLVPAKETAQRVPNSMFVVIGAVFSYIEMYAQFKAGEVSEGKSFTMFMEGMLDLFPNLRGNERAEPIFRALYKSIRCGMYHNAFVGRHVFLVDVSDRAIALHDFPPEPGRDGTTAISMNPAVLTDFLINHFDSYIRRLRNPGNVELRENFQKRFDLDREAK